MKKFIYLQSYKSLLSIRGALTIAANNVVQTYEYVRYEIAPRSSVYIVLSSNNSIRVTTTGDKAFEFCRDRLSFGKPTGLYKRHPTWVLRDHLSIEERA